MPFDLWVSFTVAAAVLAVAPGPDNLFVLLQSAMYGAKAGIFVTLGLCVGVLIQTLMAAFGVAAVVAASPTLLLIVQLAGAAYLLYLAWGAWRAPVGNEDGESASKYPKLTHFQLWRRGILMNITNPKVLIFFLAFSSVHYQRLNRNPSDDSNAHYGLDVFSLYACCFLYDRLVCRHFS